MELEIVKEKTRTGDLLTVKRHVKGEYKIKSEIRYDDRCGNGHKTFSITGEIRFADGGGSSGCIHEDIAKYLPEYEKYIKWHLVSEDGPMQYVSNSMYVAGDKDCHSLRKGEEKIISYKKAIFFNDVPLPYSVNNGRYLVPYLESLNGDYSKLEVEEVSGTGSSGGVYTRYGLKGQGVSSWHFLSFDTRQDCELFIKALQTCKVEFVTVPDGIRIGEGKEPDLEAARHTAIWPEAELEDFTEEKLLARLPKLMQEFYKDMEELGFDTTPLEKKDGNKSK